jgi:hypothetical protein
VTAHAALPGPQGPQGPAGPAGPAGTPADVTQLVRLAPPNDAANVIVPATSAGVVLATRNSGDAVTRWALDGAGKLSWGPGGATAMDATLQRLNAAQLGLVDTKLTGQRSSSSGQTFAAAVVGDAVERFSMDATGSMEWGPGTGARDSFLRRQSSGWLQAPLTFIEVTRSSGGVGAFGSKVSTDASSRWRWIVLADGSHQWGDGTSAADAFLARVGAAQVQFTNTILEVKKGGSGEAAYLTNYSAATVNPFRLNADGSMEWGSGGLARDAFMSRAAAGVLQVGSTTLQLQTVAATNNVLRTQVSGDATQRFVVDGAGSHKWGDGTSATDSFLQRTGAAQVQFVDTQAGATRAGVASLSFFARLNNDALGRWVVRADGQHEWGDGTNARDVTLARTGANALSLAAALTLSGTAGSVWTSSSSAAVTQFRALGAGTAFSSNAATLTTQILLLGLLQGDTNARFFVDHAGIMKWGPGGTTAQDVTLQRPFAGALQITGQLRTVGAATTTPSLETFVTGDANQRLIVGADGKLSWGPGNASTDVVLSRIGSSLLRVDGALQSSGTSAAAKGFATRVTGDTAERLTVGADGKLSWGDGASAQDAVLARIGTTRLDFSGADIGVTRAAASSGAYRAQVTGDANTRFFIFADGKQEWGDGTNARDVFLYRSAANTLVLDTAFLRVLRSATANTVFQALVNGEAQSRFAVLANGQQEWGDGTASRDTFLSRSAAGLMNLNGAGLQIQRSAGTSQVLLGIVTGDVASRVALLANGQLEWGDGTNARDAKLYRSGAGIVATDGRFRKDATASNSAAFGAFTTGDSFDRFVIRADGSYEWGSGATATDTTLSRSQANWLLTNSFFQSVRTNTTDGTFGTKIGADAISRWTVDATGRQEWGDGTAARDMFFYRQSAGLAKFQGAVFQVNRTNATDGALGTSFASNTLNSLLVTADGAMAWGDGTNARDVFLARSQAGRLQLSSADLQVVRATTGSAAFTAAVSGEAASRFTALASGQHEWGDGTNARDTFLLRAGAGILRVDAGAAGYLQVKAPGASNAALAVFYGTGVHGFQLRGDGQLQWGDGTNPLDAFLLRSSAGELRFLSTRTQWNGLSAGAQVLAAAATGDTSERWRVYNSGLTEWGSGATARDTNLYRTGVAALRTDGAFTVGGDLTVQGNFNFPAGVVTSDPSPMLLIGA